VIEGYELRAASIYTQRGGYCFDSLLRERIEAKGISSLKPWFEKYSNFTPTKSFYRVHSNDIVRDIKQWMSFIPYKPLDFNKRTEYYDEVLTFPPSFELPDGTFHFPLTLLSFLLLFLHTSNRYSNRSH